MIATKNGNGSIAWRKLAPVSVVGALSVTIPGSALSIIPQG